MSRRPLKIAVEGCGHGTLHAIYASIEESSRKKGWENGPDLVIIGGDFQAVRNADDLSAMSVPAKYREIGDFWEYYAGKRTAPYLTVFIGGNHEASNHLFELYYGGWAAPNIYYLGAANVIRFGGLRIAGLSGIWKGYNYRKPHYERLPYSQDDVKSIYHVRELDVRKLLQLRSQVDIGLSHDWPEGVEWLGNHSQLFRLKPDFRQDAETGRLGSKAARYVLDQLRPPYWFSAHLHCKYSAVISHEKQEATEQLVPEPISDVTDIVPSKNEDEIDIDMDDEDDKDNTATAQEAKAEPISDSKLSAQPPETSLASNGVSAELRAQLPASFNKPAQTNDKPDKIPPGITNTSTRFLALDKCLPKRRFLQLLEIEPVEHQKDLDPPRLTYDPEWLAITRVFANELQLGNPEARVPVADIAAYPSRIDAERERIEKNIVQKGLLAVPGNFEKTAPSYLEDLGLDSIQRPPEYTSPQTATFCRLLGIANPFDISEEERQVRYSKAGSLDQERPHNARGGRGGRGRGDRGRARGFGRSRGRGGFRPR